MTVYLTRTFALSCCPRCRGEAMPVTVEELRRDLAGSIVYRLFYTCPSCRYTWHQDRKQP